MNKKELNTLIREALQKEQWKKVGGSWRYSPSRIAKWKKRVASEKPEEEIEAEEAEKDLRKRAMAAHEKWAASLREENAEEVRVGEDEVRDGLVSYYREMYEQYGDDSFPAPDALKDLSVEEIEELIVDLESAEVAFETEFAKGRASK